MGLLSRLGRALTGPPISETSTSPLLKRDVEPLEGTRMSLWNSQIPSFWAENGLGPWDTGFWPGNGLLAERVWVANRCIQMNAQQIASMPIRFESPNVTAEQEPAWVSNPDPEYFPNGVADAIFALVRDIYGWGYGLAYVTSRYATGYPRNWTVIPACQCEPRWSEDGGSREYKLGERYLDPFDVIQIDRDPGYGAHGTSAIKAFAQISWGLLAAGNQAMSVQTGGTPLSTLKNVTAPQLTAEQAQAAQEQWMAAVARRNGAPPVLDKNWEFTTHGFSPVDLALLDTQEFDAKAIMAAFGVPAVLMNMAVDHGMTYQNPGMLGEMWWRFELRTLAKRLADAFTAQALPSGQWVWFDAQDTFQPLHQETGVSSGPFASDEDDPQAAALAQDTQAAAPSVAKASPAQQTGQPRLTAIGGNR